jgi:hypothetical protein
VEKIFSFVLFGISLFFLPLPLTITALITLLSILLYFGKPVKYLTIIVFLALCIFQISTTRIRSVFEFSGYDQYLHQQQLNAYPPTLYRIANIIENKVETDQTYRFRQNFFNCFDLVNYFKNYFLTILFIPLVFGLIKSINHPHKLFIILYSISVLLLTFIGTEGKYGPVILLPFIINIISFYSLEK